jgi:hypothetical protein
MCGRVGLLREDEAVDDSPDPHRFDRTLACGREIACVRWSPDSSLLYVVDDANQLKAIDVNTGRVMGAGINLRALSQVTIRPTR